ncbi:MAG: hypothetical protein GX879_06985 [Bacteroidales bacterium]|nr:hypothetical protein [Bacteroidales bacterium]
MTELWAAMLIFGAYEQQSAGPILSFKINGNTFNQTINTKACENQILDIYIDELVNGNYPLTLSWTVNDDANHPLSGSNVVVNENQAWFSAELNSGTYNIKFTSIEDDNACIGKPDIYSISIQTTKAEFAIELNNTPIDASFSETYCYYENIEMKFTEPSNEIEYPLTVSWTVNGSDTHSLSGNQVQITEDGQTLFSSTLSMGNYEIEFTEIIDAIGCEISNLNDFTFSFEVIDCVITNLQVGDTEFTNSQVCSGVVVEATAEVSGSIPPYTYQWQYYTGTAWASVTNNKPAGFSYNGTAEETLEIIPAVNSAQGTWAYRVRVRDSQNNTVYSNENSLSVGSVLVESSEGTNEGIYADLAKAFTAINAGTHKGEILVKIICDIESNAAVTIKGSVEDGNPNYTSILVQPVGHRTVIGERTGGLITFNAAENVTIDGINDENNSLTIINSSEATNNYTSTIRFYNSSQYNIVKNCTLKASTQTTNGGVILFSTSTATPGLGNNYNIIENNNITKHGETSPLRLIYVSGSGAYFNQDNIIRNNNFYDFFHPEKSSYAIYNYTYNEGLSITGNSFYQTSEYTLTNENNINHSVIFISGNTATKGFEISDNYIGGSQPECNGNWVCSGHGAVSLKGIVITSDEEVVSSIQNNTIKNIEVASTHTSVFYAIYAYGKGSYNIGTEAGNTIGEMTGTGSITAYTPNSYGNFIPAEIKPIMQLDTVLIEKHGSGYILANTTVSLLGGEPDIEGTVELNIVNGEIKEVIVTNPGYGYKSCPEIIVSGDGEGFEANPVTLTVADLVIENSGQGYALKPTLSIARAGAVITATGTAEIEDGQISVVNLTREGRQFTSVPAITVNVANVLTYGIYSSNTGKSVIKNNNFGSIQIGGQTSEYSYTLSEIRSAGANADREISNNIIGGETANSIVVGLPTQTTGICYHYGIYNTVTGSSEIKDNIIRNLSVNGTTTSRRVYGIYKTGVSTGLDISNNIIEDIYVPTLSTIYGIHKAAGVSDYCNISNNIIRRFKSESTTLTMSGIILASDGNVFNNKIEDLSSSELTTGAVLGVAVSGGEDVSIYNNTISNLYSENLTSGRVCGIRITGGADNKIYNNKIYDFHTTMEVITTGVVCGIESSGAALRNNTIYNNLIGDLRAPNSSTATSRISIRGISVINTDTLETISRVYYNTIYLNSPLVGSRLNSAGVYFSSNENEKRSKLEMINNIIVNKTETSGNGITAAFRAYSADLINYSELSNNNSFYAGEPGPHNFVFYVNSSNKFLDIEDFKAFVGTQDQSSIQYDPEFLSINGADDNFLHLIRGDNCQLDGKGMPIAGFNFDFDNEERDILALDIGADEVETDHPSLLYNSPYTNTDAYVWSGHSSNDEWTNIANWIKYNGTDYEIPTNYPNATNANVYIRHYNECNEINQPSLNLSSATVCNNILIESTGTLSVVDTSALIAMETLLIMEV